MRIPAYGGSLFDPARFPFLTAVTAHGTLAIMVSDRVMLHGLQSVQQAVLRGGDARRISFRDIDVEQIGYIYEGLLGYTAIPVDKTYLGLRGAKGQEPEITLSVLENLAQANPAPRKLADAIRVWVEKDQPSAQPQSAAAIAKGIGSIAEPNVINGLSQAVGGDRQLRERVLRWLGVMRMDLRGRPFVVLDGGLMVKETPSRKNAGAHYTPKSLAKEIVLHALEPLCYAPGPYQTADKMQWKLKSSDDLLSLKVADIACGSGAFLVSAASYLADRVVEAWTAENPANAQRHNLHRRAVREVVANCLYGADINDMAVEMCKLSLWLVSLDRNSPFSFVDDKIFLGNSLLGLTSLDQLRRLNIAPSRVPATAMIDFYDIDIDAIIRKAVDLRRKLASEIDENDPARNSAAKHRQLAELRRVTGDLRKIADGVVAAGLPLGGKPGRALDEAYENLRIAVKEAYGNGGQTESRHLDSIIDAGLTPTVPTDYKRWRPLHWVIEAPDVIVERGGFDAIVGNPPFLGGQKLTGALGTNIRDWFVNVLAAGAKGSADQVAYFFLRAQKLLAGRSALGLIATNTIAQGDTRQVGLDQMVSSGFTITQAIQSRSWPANTANLEYAAVWGSLGSVASDVPRVSDEQPVKRITTLLEPGGRIEGNPIRLHENANIAFQGCNVLGSGFILDPTEAETWIAQDARNADVVFPYLNGDDLNSRPDCSASRWVIDFNERPLDEARTYKLPMARVEALVKPERARNSNKQRREIWWRFTRNAPEMRRAVARLGDVLVMAQVSKAVIPARVFVRQVFDQKLVIFAVDGFDDQALLSSSIHQAWGIKYSSTLESRVSYAPTDAFLTFPRCSRTTRVREAGVRLNEERRETMLRRQLGLTKLYNLVNDPGVADGSDRDVARIRSIHTEIDEAVIDAYGWSDIRLHHGFHTYRQMERWTVCPAARVEILDRLLEENHRRAALQMTAGKAKKGRRSRTWLEGEETLPL